jgi:hypothetical protein
MSAEPTTRDAADADACVARWRRAGGSERANRQLFVGELCALLGLPAPQPAQGDERDDAYVFERRIRFAHGDGSRSAGFIDCYRRGAFVLEAKKLKGARDGAPTRGFDDALLRARAQAEGYARALPAAEGILPVHRFPVSPGYRVEAAELRVVAVAAQRRRPGFWAGRVRGLGAA